MTLSAVKTQKGVQNHYKVLGFPRDLRLQKLIRRGSPVRCLLSPHFSQASVLKAARECSYSTQGQLLGTGKMDNEPCL